ncbi:hypothetical protein [Nannocystis punicea]|uniref:DUF5658 domain-containing protein n=1 Tax=Nannocystis punicea TaxID=2995304 RepID=A0ABY7HBQ5_9BACT|nr:hypothetical protein [Nannocystis poenicansa]WAS96703.1 hypothetical protein O0S08_11180 [Nannocystis poenicansa]
MAEQREEPTVPGLFAHLIVYAVTFGLVLCAVLGYLNHRFHLDLAVSVRSAAPIRVPDLDGAYALTLLGKAAGVWALWKLGCLVVPRLSRFGRWPPRLAVAAAVVYLDILVLRL